ncbi:GNAT family N-acetyltransferase [Streptomyces cavernicola]|uniref:GNAT family N-acetyltransferase n=1 Tax=Streptomyces cavernicola TaxID=3043613 RepID=A0ABT6SIC0_9ACTN|nr:GNAT family N-acetyltransferase [Streptomyces sp. B-S-A6]MDI3407407.1 GNAT family N-acetyltransferase [Streptomyces sp. B-S-A6]
MPVDVRLLTEPDFPDWVRALNTGFLRAPTSTDEEIEDRRSSVGLSRMRGAFDDGRCVATYRSFGQRLTAVGGAEVAANAVSNVTVSPTHRRRGLLTRMITEDLGAAKERGDVAATLIAAEYPIYGRYGFGPATRMAEWEIDVPRTGLDPRWSGPEDGGRIDLVDASDVRKLGPALHERVRRATPGAVDRGERWWQVFTGEVRPGWAPWKDPFFAVHRSAAGEVDGLLAYVCDAKWGDGKQPLNTATVLELTAASPAAERALWRYVCSVDWVQTVRTGPRAPDALVADLFPNARAARIVTLGDWLWVRILDVPAALEARTYGMPGALVVEVGDRLGFAGGRYCLEVGTDGRGSCTPTRDAAEVALDVRELGALWLGDASAVRLAALGRLTEERAGAAAIADALLGTPRSPWCPDVF